MHRLIALAAAVAFAAPAFGQGAASALTRIGAAAAVRGSVKAQAPNAAVGRVVESGKPLFLNDHVTTDRAGKLQVMLLDETVFTVGPDSDMVLDTFLYDPFTSAGTVSASVTKGVFRFVTGKVARKDPSKMKIKLPVGTIGIRGTVATFKADAQGTTAILLGPGSHGDTDDSGGAISFEYKGETRVMDEPGRGVTCKAGELPSPVTDMSATADQIAGELAEPAGKPAKDATAGKESASSASGEETAMGQAPASLEQASADKNSGSAALLSQAAQTQGIVDGIATWDDVRTLQSGTGFFFNGHSPVSCTGPCASSNPQGSLQLYIDFGARTVGGSTAIAGPSGSSGSFIHIHGVGNAANGDFIEQPIGLGGAGLNPISFSALTGNASLTLNGTNLGSTTSSTLATGNFNGSTIDLVNSGGVAAAQAKTTMSFSGTNTASAAVSANGTFLAPR